MTVMYLDAWALRLAIYGALVAFAWQLHAEADKVTLVKNKQVIAGKITKDDRDGLEMDTGQGKRTFNSAEIAEVEWDVTDDNFHTAVSAFRSGAYNRAADVLQDILSSKETLDRIRPIARPYVFYLFAECKY